MKVFASMDASLPLEQVPAYVARVERLGYDGIHVPAVLERIGADVRRGEVAAGRDPGPLLPPSAWRTAPISCMP